MKQEKILIIGASGQIGSVLTHTLSDIYGENNVIATDIRQPTDHHGHFEILDVLNTQALGDIVAKYGITQIYHLAAILSAKGETMPMFAWQFNMTSFFNVIDVARQFKISKIFFPSSIAAFGPSTPKYNTPQATIMIPETVYGISKSCAEDWCNYFWLKEKMDIRSVRYPGIIGYQSLPGGGTTDYAVDIYHKAVKSEPFECFLKADTALPMIYMDDAIRATIELMEAPSENVKIRTSYNLASMSFSPQDIAESIKKQVPDFSISYKPDFRQAIAESWPASIDDSEARKDWGWRPNFDLDAMTADMLAHLSEMYSKEIVHH